MARVYGGVIVGISDAQYRIGVIVGAAVLVLGITAVRFCGSVDVPAKIDAPTIRRTPASRLLEESNASPTIYQDHLAKDAGQAGLKAPTYQEMTRRLRFRVDEGRRVLEIGDPPIEAAGLRLEVRRSGDAIVLAIENRTPAALGYVVVTEPTPKIAGCTSVPALSFDAMVIGHGQTEVRVECVWRPGIAIAVTRVETVELSAMSAWYLSQVSPVLVGIEPRITRGHREVRKGERCITLMSQAVRAGIENGEIGWRDLVDFYARHRCQTYQFPPSYRAFTVDGERTIPAM
jgi:hypothetical protein